MQPIPTINVNLKPCDCHTGVNIRPSKGDCPLESCPGKPVPIPCPIPRSVVLKVSPGECSCANDPGATVLALLPGRHLSSCPARPIRVACSIGGKTWEESEVVDVEPIGPMERLPVPADQCTHMDAACRELWRIVQMLALGHPATASAAGTLSEAIPALQAQRDAVFAALADMARAEEVVFQRQDAALAVFMPRFGRTFIPDRWMDEEAHSRPSASILERYIESLIEKVGVL